MASVEAEASAADGTAEPLEGERFRTPPPKFAKKPAAVAAASRRLDLPPKPEEDARMEDDSDASKAVEEVAETAADRADNSEEAQRLTKQIVSFGRVWAPRFASKQVQSPLKVVSAPENVEFASASGASQSLQRAQSSLESFARGPSLFDDLATAAALETKVAELEAKIKELVACNSAAHEQIRLLKNQSVWMLNAHDQQMQEKASCMLTISGWPAPYECAERTRVQIVMYYLQKLGVAQSEIKHFDIVNPFRKLARRATITFFDSRRTFDISMKFKKKSFSMRAWKTNGRWATQELIMAPFISEVEAVRQMPYKTVCSALENGPFGPKALQRKWRAMALVDSKLNIILQQTHHNDVITLEICNEHFDYVCSAFEKVWSRLWIHKEAWRKSTSFSEYIYQIRFVRVDFEVEWTEPQKPFRSTPTSDFSVAAGPSASSSSKGSASVPSGEAGAGWAPAANPSASQAPTQPGAWQDAWKNADPWRGWQRN